MQAVVSPNVDIFESDADVLLRADVPGVAEDAVNLSVERQTLFLEADTRADVVYRRAFLLPRTVDADHISAEIRNGVLQVKLPKTPQARPRKIEVQGVH